MVDIDLVKDLLISNGKIKEGVPIMNLPSFFEGL